MYNHSDGLAIHKYQHSQDTFHIHLISIQISYQIFCNFSINPGKKVKVSQIQLRLNRQIERFVDDKITQNSINSLQTR